MGFVKASDVKRLLQDQEFRTEIVKAVVEDPKALDDLAEDIADELEDEIEDDTELKEEIIEAAMANPDFKKKVMKELADDFG